VLWFGEPATDWETQSLPIGNGALGACVFGGVRVERLQYNEKTLWTGDPHHRGDWPAPRPGALDETRALIDRDERVSPSTVVERLGGPRVGYGAYQNFGDAYLDMTGVSGAVEGYRRELDITEAVARVSFALGGVTYRRQYIASHPRGAIVARLTASSPGQVSFTLRHTSPHPGAGVTVRGDRMTVRGTLPDNAMVYESQFRVVVDGGSLTGGEDRITVTGADSATVVLCAGTDYAAAYPDYRGEDPHDRVTTAVDGAAAQSWDALLTEHVLDHRRLFDRVTLDIGESTREALFFQYGRYLLIASSRPGSLPANLQGVWNNSTSPPWSGDYHVNINLQMNYWPAEVTNLAETAEPLFDFIDGLRAPGRVTARTMFDAPGWVVHDETTPFGYTGVHDWATAFWFPEAAAWLCQHLYEHYLFTGDTAFLRDRAYPVMREVADFWAASLHTDPRDGSLVVSPSFSPEHGDFTAGAAMSQQIVWELLSDTIAASGELGLDAGSRARWRSTLERLDPGLRIGSWGQLQEWKTDLDDPADTHRHVSHLFALHPGRRISPLSDPEYATAARVSLDARGDGGTGWSKAWKISFWARLRDGDRAHRLLREQLRSSTHANLWDTHPPFQIDGNFGATAGIAEMLLQSHTGVIDVLPALPSAWPSGAVTGLRARGNATVDVTWSGGAATSVTVTAGSHGELTVRSPLLATAGVVDLTSGAAVPVTRDGPQATFAAVAGHRYRIAS